MLGVQVDSKDIAINGKEAVEMILKKTCSSCSQGYHLVFMDLNMPEMNGFEATSIIRSMKNKKVL